STALFFPAFCRTSFPKSSSRPASITRAPSVIHRSAIALPIPVVLPVTIITLFCKRIFLNGLQHALNDLSFVHFFKSLVPFRYWPYPADDRAHIKLSACKKTDDAFPDRPVVAETAFDRDIFQYDGIKAKPEWLWPPPYFGDVTIGTHQRHGDVQRDADAGGIDHTVRTQTVDFLRPLHRIPHNSFNSVLSGSRQPFLVCFQSHDRNLTAAQFCHGGTKNSYCSGAEHQHPVARFDAAVYNHGIVGYTTRFCEARLLEGKVVRHMVEAAGRHANESGHGAIHAVAETFPGRIKVVEAPACHRIVGVNHGGGLANDTVTFFPSGNATTNRGNMATEFVTKHNRIVH